MLKKIKHFHRTKCPYRFFALLYHIAMQHESTLIELNNHIENPFREKLLKVPILDDGGHFCLHFETTKLLPCNDKMAGLLIIALLEKMDIYFAGIVMNVKEDDPDGKDEVNSVPASPILRLNNPKFYKPIEVNIEKEKASYMIAPNIEPVFKNWSYTFSRDREYVTHTISSEFVKHHTFIKNEKIDNYPVKIVNSDAGYSSHISDLNNTLRKQDRLIIGMAPYDAGFKFKFEVTPGQRKGRFLIKGIKSPSGKIVRERARSILRTAFDNEVDILIFPELTVDHDTFTDITKWLATNNKPEKIKLVIAGSFHKEHEGGGYVNRSAMLNYYGDVVWEVVKKTPFEMKGSDFLKLQGKQPIKKTKIEPKKKYAEKIQTDFPLVFIDTPIGRMSTLICLDYLNTAVGAVLCRTICGFFFVPAMTPSIEKFKAEAINNYGFKHHILSAICASKSIQKQRTKNDNAEVDSFSFVSVGEKECPAHQKLNKSQLLIYKIHEAE